MRNPVKIKRKIKGLGNSAKILSVLRGRPQCQFLAVASF